MGLFDSIFRPKKNKEATQAASAANYFEQLNGYRPVFHSWRGSIYESELVRSAIDARARHISKLDVTIQGAAQPDLQRRLRRAPNTFQTWSQFLYRLSTILDMYNTAFVVPEMDDYLRVIGYYPVLPRECEVVDYKGEPWLRYRFAWGDVAAVELRRCAIMTKFQLMSDFFGESNGALKETLDLLAMQAQGVENAIENSANYRFMARLSNFSQPDDLANERKRFSEKNLSADAGGGGLLLFPNTYSDIKQINMQPWTPDAAQLELVRTNVFNYFAVNENVLQSKATGDDWAAFYESVVEVFAVMFSQSMTRAIFTDREIASGALLMATANRVQYMTNSDKLNYTNNALDRGMITIDEAREVFNLPPLPDGRGNVTIARGEYYSTNDGWKAGADTTEEAETNATEN